MNREIAIFLIFFCVQLSWGAMFSCERVMKPDRLNWGNENIQVLQSIDNAKWLWHPKYHNYESVYLRFRNEFELTHDVTEEISLSADERFVLFLDGVELARGPHRCLPQRWTYQSYRLTLPKGKHRLEAVVSREGDYAPIAQLTLGGGFILKAEGELDHLLTTGRGVWKVAPLTNTTPMWNGCWRFTGAAYISKGCSLLDAEPSQDQWMPPMVVVDQIKANSYGCSRKGWQLFPSTLPDMISRRIKPGVVKGVALDANRFAPYEKQTPSSYRVSANALLKDGKPLIIPPNTQIRLLWDLGDYYSAFPELRVSGGKGASIEWDWAEGLYQKDVKPNRGQFEGYHLTYANAKGDRFIMDGRENARFTTLWWRCGRWCQLMVQTSEEPLTITDLGLIETRYPLENESRFICDDETIQPIIRLAQRGMQMCCHEMLFDCPFYEQQMYPGDTRVQLLILSAMNRDDRMIRRAIELYDFSRRLNGFVGMNYPTRGTQDSATYTLCWVLMFRDYMLYHDDMAWLKARIPGMRATLHGMSVYENKDGLLARLPGWSFMDWVPAWRGGIAPDGNSDNPSALNNLFYVLALQSAADTEAVVGDKAMADYWRAKATRIGKTIVEKFWSSERNLLADNLSKDKFSEHAQCLSILAGVLTPEQEIKAFDAMLSATDLAQTTVYFSHYLFDVYGKMGRGDLILKRLDLWRDYVKMDLKTPLESPGNARSDCHAWGSHPIYHLQKGVAGVSPIAPSFKRVRIAPSPGKLKFLDAVIPHPKGEIALKLDFGNDQQVKGIVTLPPQTDGIFLWNGKQLELKAGNNRIDL